MPTNAVRLTEAASSARPAAEWLTGWVAAACEQQVELAVEADAYLRRRLAEAVPAARVTADHADLLVLPRALS
jgi:hypothetical protein